MRIVKAPDAPTARAQAGQALNTFFSAHQNQPILFLISGGSSLEALQCIDTLKWTVAVTVGVLDDRFSQDPAINNYLQFSKTVVYQNALGQGVALLSSVPRPGETVAGWGAGYNQILTSWLEAHPDGLTLALMGIGTDGHTAGIMRYPNEPATFKKLFVDTDKKVVGYDATGRNRLPLRMTSTIPFLKSIDLAIVYAVGITKKAALIKVLAARGTLWQTPARVVRDMKAVWVFTDQEI